MGRKKPRVFSVPTKPSYCFKEKSLKTSNYKRKQGFEKLKGLKGSNQKNSKKNKMVPNREFKDVEHHPVKNVLKSCNNQLLVEA